MKQARFIQLVEVQQVLYALDEEGNVWQYGDDSATTGHAWMPLSRKRQEAPSPEPSPTVGFIHDSTRKE